MCKVDFWPLLQQARDLTYTVINVKRAWTGAGLIPYNRGRILSLLGGPKTIRSPGSSPDIMQTPTNPSQHRALIAHTQQLLHSKDVRTPIVQVVNLLAKLGLQEQALRAIASHETNQLRARLKMKEGHKKSRVRLKNGLHGGGILMTSVERDLLKQELEDKMLKKAEKEIRAKNRGKRQSKKKEASEKSKGKRRVSFASIESEDWHILTDSGQ